MIRVAGNQDIESIFTIDQKVLRSNWHLKDYTDAINDENKICYVYEVDDLLVGFVLLQKIDPDIEILQIAVCESYQRRGIASKLLRVLSKQAYHSVFLEVKSSNTQAIAFYQFMGFETIATRKNYYGPKMDANVMRKVLAC